MVKPIADITQPPARPGLYGCHNQPRPTAKSWYWGQDGWHDDLFPISRPGITRMPRMVKISNTMSRGCKYDGNEKDQRCAGCRHANNAIIQAKDGKDAG